MRARYYNPAVGRFITEDSVRGKDKDPLSLNLYTYCHNDPLNYWDPSGHTEGSYYYKKYTSEYNQGKTGTYTYTNRYSKKVTSVWLISEENFLDSNSLTQAQITAICNKHNPGLVSQGFDKAIYGFAKNKGINPKVILATLAQEQSWCSNGDYKSAFGVGPGGNPISFANGNMGGLAISVNSYLKLFNAGVALEKKGNIGSMFVNQDASPYPETKAVFGVGTKNWQRNHQSDVKFMENGQYVTPVNAAMYAKLNYTPWVDFPPQGSHPLDDWHNIYMSF